MPTVPRSPNVVQAPTPQVDPTVEAMTAAMIIGERKAEEWQAQLRHIGRGDWANNPAELYNSYRRDGHSPEQARSLTIDSLSIGTGFDREEVEERLRQVPMS